MIITMSPFMLFLHIFILIFICFYIADLFRSIKIKKQKLQKDNRFTYDPDVWIYTQRNIILNDDELERLERRLTFDNNSGFIPEKSILYYMLNTRKINPMKRNETVDQFVIRSLKNDFEKNNGISFDRFMDGYKKILLNTPEHLI